jgi:predicted lipase
MQKWAFYPYDAQPSDTQLKNMKIFEDSKTKAQAVVGYDSASNSIITSFRGSDNIMNWIENADFVKTPYTVGGCSNCNVHTGFKNSYDSIKDSIKSHLTSVLFPTYSSATVVVTGHSLGAAEAMLAAVD